jgi:hypothetical protein
MDIIRNTDKKIFSRYKRTDLNSYFVAEDGEEVELSNKEFEKGRTWIENGDFISIDEYNDFFSFSMYISSHSLKDRLYKAFRLIFYGDISTNEIRINRKLAKSMSRWIYERL